MNLALLSQMDLFAAIQELMRWLTSPTARASYIAPRTSSQAAHVAAKKAASCPLITIDAVQPKLGHRPVRVLRVVEAGQARTCVGRMVISGRMADVCAELDRLVAREAMLL
jgi:hypothetical protein